MIPESSISLRRSENGQYIVDTGYGQEIYQTLGAALDSLRRLRKEDTKSGEPRATRESILDAAKRCVCGDREQDYGSPEDNFAVIAALWTAYTGTDITPKDVAMMMALLKIARAKAGSKPDTYIDLAGYAACGGELEVNNREVNNR